MRNDEEGGLLERLFIPLCFVVMLAPLPLWPFVRHGEWGQDFWFAVKRATPPIFLAMLIGMRLCMPRSWATATWPARGAAVVLATAIFAFLAQVHVGVINRWFGHSEPVVISGIVLKKLDNGEGAYGVEVHTAEGVRTLRVSRREHDQARVLGEFSKRYMRGSLGLLYIDD